MRNPLRKINPRKLERSIGVVALILGMTGTVYSGYLQVHDEHQVACQAAINKEFLAILKERAGISNDNTNNINNFVLDLIHSKNNTPAQDAADINAYLTELAKINGELKSATYPSIGGC
jgi:hypothetical protein